MKINSNLQAQIANSVLKSNESRYSKSTEKLSSGYKINHAEDAPAAMAITNRMHAQIASLEKATQNSSNGISVIQTAEGALSEVQNMVQRINELSVKASNGTMTDNDREAIQKEIDQLSEEIERIAADTEYNTQNLLGGEQALKGYSSNPKIEVVDYDQKFPQGDYSVSFTKTGDTVTATVTGLSEAYEQECVDGVATITLRDGSTLKLGYDADNLPDATNPADKVDLQLHGVGGMKIQIGSKEGQEIALVIPKISLKNMGINELDVRTEEGAHAALDKIGGALDFISSVRSSLGAYQNRLESTVSSLNISVENLTNSYSTIKDVDMADEMVEYTTLQVLVQAGTSMLTQANEQPQQALQLLQ